MGVLADILKGRTAQIGETRQWTSGPHRKVAPGMWALMTGGGRKTSGSPANLDELGIKFPTYAGAHRPEMAAAIGHEERLLHARTDTEAVVLLLDGGRDRIEHPGGIDQVNIPHETGARSRRDGYAVLLHNHLDDTIFSAEDLQTAAASNVAELRAVTRSGLVWVMKRPERGWPRPRKTAGAVTRAWLAATYFARLPTGIRGQLLLRDYLNLEVRDWDLEVTCERLAVAKADGRAVGARDGDPQAPWDRARRDAEPPAVQGVRDGTREGAREAAQDGEGPLSRLLKSAATSGRTHVPQHSVRAPVVEAPKRYRKEYPLTGYIDFQGLPIDIENLKGSCREGVDKNGRAWKVTMGAHYGELPGAAAQDGDYLDVYVGPDADSPLVVVVHQLDTETGKPDEDKVCLGWRTAKEAVAFYKTQYDKPGFYGGHDAMSIGRFRRLAMDPGRRGRMIKGGGGSLAGLLKGALTDAPELWIELPEAYGAALYGRLFKAGTHRYIKRVRGPSGHYRYWYSVSTAKHDVGHEEHLIVGTAVRFGPGHYHITAEHADGRVTIRHDEPPHDERTVTKAELSKMLREHHAAALTAHRERAALPASVRRLAPGPAREMRLRELAVEAAQRKAAADPAKVADATPIDFTADPLKTVTAHHSDFVRGNVSAAEHKRRFAALMEQQDAVKAALLKKYDKAQLRRLSGSFHDEKKEAYAAHLAERLAQHYMVEDGLVYSPMKERAIDAVKRNVDKLDDAAMAAHATKNAAAVAARQAKIDAHLAAIAEPKTLADFEIFEKVKGRASMTPEQRRKHDELAADASLSARKTAEGAKAEIKHVPEAGAAGMTVEAGTHSRDGYPIFTVKMGTRVERDAYDRLNIAAKKLGGYYSRFGGGFVFKDEKNARTFAGVGQGDVSAKEHIEGRQAAKRDARTERLRDSADRLHETAEATLGQDRKVNTNRRADMAAGIMSRAYGDQATAKTMHAIAGAIESGTAKHLAGVSARTHVDQLDHIARMSQHYRATAEGQSYQEQERTRGAPLSEADVEHVRYPHPMVRARDLATLLVKVKGASGTKHAIARLHALIDPKTQDNDTPIRMQKPEEVEALQTVVDAAKARGAGSYELSGADDSLADHKRMKAMGIHTPAELRQALREYIPIRGQKRQSTAEEQVKAKAMEIARQKPAGYFPTPDAIAHEMVQRAGVKPGETVLEPSAGTGHIADAAHAAGGAVKAIERHGGMREVLSAKGHELVGDDALQHKETYDKVIMNPPFEAGQDIEHVRHAFEHNLKPGGKLVAIMSEGPFFREDKKAQAFREWLDAAGGTSEKMDAGTFKTSDRATGVSTRMVVVEKPAVTQKGGRPTGPLTRLMKSAAPAPAEDVELSEVEGARLWAEQEARGGLAGLLAKASKGDAKSNHKYIRRVPDGKGGWRYFYSEASTAHAAKEGERINLKHQGVHEVVRVHDDGKVQLRHTGTGEERTVHVSELHKEIHAVYGSAMDRGAERTVKAVLAKVGHVDATPAGLIKAYRARFEALGVSRSHAEALLHFVASRKGWHDDAKRTLAELCATKQNAHRVRTIASGAEALAKAEKAAQVAAKHVAKAAALPTGPALDDIRSKVATMAGKFEASLGAVEAVGEHAPHRRAMVDYAHTVATSPAMAELETLVTAYPAMAAAPEYQRMRALQTKVRELSGGAPAKDDGKGIRGAETVVFVADAAGNPTPQTARYRLIEAGEAVASHDPTQGFKRNTAYPEGVQERAYHSDKEHQDVVRTNARKLQPALVINTNPDAVNGPPLMSRDGIVLGGNSRTMAVQIAHEDGGAASSAYVKHLTDNAATFGFTAADVAKMKKPMLVREVDTEGADKKALGVLVRRYNETYVQGMDPRVDQVARARLVTPGMLDTLGQAMSEKASTGDDRYPTLSAYLDSPRAKQLIEEMGHAGIIDRRNRAVYLRENGSLNEDGKTFVERLMVGKVLPDPDLLGEMKPSQVTAMARSTPQIVRAASHGHDLAPHLAEAFKASVYMDRNGLRSVGELDRDQGLGDFAARTAGDGGTGGWDEKPKLEPEAKALLEIIRDKPGAVQMAGAFRDIAQHAARNPVGQADLAGASKSTADILRMVSGGGSARENQQAGLFRGGLLATMLKGPLYVGPRGGRYGNAAHTEPYRESTDRAIGETPEKKAERAAKVKAGTARAVGAHETWQRALKDCNGGPESDHTCRKAWQGLYDALDHLGRAMHLDVHDGEDWAEAAAARLRSQGHKVSLKFASGHGPSADEAKRQIDMFKGRRPFWRQAAAAPFWRAA